jgi:calpain-15
MDSLSGNLTEEELFDMHGDCGFEWNSLVWLRPEEFYQNKFTMYGDSISPDDIMQGSLGDCYYLSVLAALAEWPHRIERILVTNTTNKNGIYGVRICDMGEWRDVVFDDQIPCFGDDRTPVFSNGRNNKLWVILLEKAWAICYGNYAKIEAGLTREALHDLTGAPCKYFLTADMTDKEKDGMWH